MEFHVFDSFSEGIQVIDSQLRSFYLNHAIAAQAGTTVQRLLGNKMTDMFPGIEHSKAYHEICGCLEDGREREFVNEFDNPNGKRVFQAQDAAPRRGRYDC